MSLRQRLQERVVAALLPEIDRQVRALLLPRFEAVRLAREEVAALRHALEAADARAATIEARRDRRPFTAETTIHAAHARHPGVGALFARRGLPACPDCAVGKDETIAEAALGEGFAVDDLLSELNALLRQ